MAAPGNALAGSMRAGTRRRGLLGGFSARKSLARQSRVVTRRTLRCPTVAAVRFVVPPFRPTMSAFNEERVLSVHHWTDRLFTFTTTRDTALRFSNGHFTMIGLKVDGKNLLREIGRASCRERV